MKWKMNLCKNYYFFEHLLQLIFIQNGGLNYFSEINHFFICKCFKTEFDKNCRIMIFLNYCLFRKFLFCKYINFWKLFSIHYIRLIKNKSFTKLFFANILEFNQNRICKKLSNLWICFFFNIRFTHILQRFIVYQLSTFKNTSIYHTEP